MTCPRCHTQQPTHSDGDTRRLIATRGDGGIVRWKVLCDGCYVATAIEHITRGVFNAVAEARLNATTHHHRRTTCTRCGCLIHPDETCPGCRAKTTRKAA